MPAPLRSCLLSISLLLALDSVPAADAPPGVTNTGQRWEIAGDRHRVVLDANSLQLELHGGARSWRLEPSFAGDLEVRAGAKSGRIGLATATNRVVTPYSTGYARGVKVELSGYRLEDTDLDLQLQLLLTLDGKDEEFVCEIVATDGMTRIQELLWPGSVEAGFYDATVVPFMQGMLLPRDWPEKAWLYDTLSYGRGLYMPWFGFQKAGAGGGLLVVLETAADGGCQFTHPPGGPTVLRSRWVASLGRWSYPRRARFCLLDGDYVAMAKRYRRDAIEKGRFVSLTEKIARSPRVANLVGTPVVHTSILYHIQPESSYYSTNNPAQNHQLVTFDARAAELRQLAGRGIRKAYVHLDGWGARGYDNLHPDVLPPCLEAGGWEGMKRFADVCDELGFTFAIHDQYRDFYLDAPSYDARHTLLDENGNRPLHSIWYGGRQSVLCSRLAPGYVRRNHQAILDHGIKLRGAYLDVFSVVPPDECFAPEHPVTREQCLQYRGECLEFVRSYGGIVSSEEPSDWSIRHLDLVHHGPYALRPGPGSGPAMGIPVPLFNLVYHDALLTPWSLDKGAWGIPETDLGYLHGLGNAGLPYVSLAPDEAELKRVRTMCALHRRVGLLELKRHAFLDAQRRRQEFVYADGTRVEIDLDKDAFTITPAIEPGG